MTPSVPAFPPSLRPCLPLPFSPSPFLSLCPPPSHAHFLSLLISLKHTFTIRRRNQSEKWHLSHFRHLSLDLIFNVKKSTRPGPAAKLPALAELSKGAVSVTENGEGEGTLVVAGGCDGTIRLLALQASEGDSESEDGEPLPSSPRLSLEPLGEFEHHVAPIASLAFDTSGGMPASGGRDGSVALWDSSGL